MSHDRRMAELKALELAYRDQPLQMLGDHFLRAEDVLSSASDYQELTYALKALRILGAHLGERLLASLRSFIDSVSQRALTLDGELIPPPKAYYSLSTSTLVWTAFEVALAVRKVAAEQLLDFLLEYASSTGSVYQEMAVETLEYLAALDQRQACPAGRFDVTPQRKMIGHLLEKPDDFLVGHKAILLKFLFSIFQPLLEEHPANGGTPAVHRGGDYGLLAESNRGKCVKAGEEVRRMRKAALQLLKRLYRISPDDSVMYVMFSSMARNPDFDDAEIIQLIESDALEVLDFFHDFVGDTDLDRSLNIEQSAFWHFYRNGTPAMRLAAKSLKRAINTKPLSDIYIRLLINSDWESVDHAIRHPEEPRVASDRAEQIAIEEIVAKIDINNSPEWRDRLIAIAATKRIRAHELKYGRLLKAIGKDRPYLGMDLLRETDLLADYLPRLLQGLWLSDRRDEMVLLARTWIVERKHVQEIARSIQGVADPALEVLARMLKT